MAGLESEFDRSLTMQERRAVRAIVNSYNAGYIDVGRDKFIDMVEKARGRAVDFADQSELDLARVIHSTYKRCEAILSPLILRYQAPRRWEDR